MVDPEQDSITAAHSAETWPERRRKLAGVKIYGMERDCLRKFLYVCLQPTEDANDCLQASKNPICSFCKKQASTATRTVKIDASKQAIMIIKALFAVDDSHVPIQIDTDSWIQLMGTNKVKIGISESKEVDYLNARMILHSEAVAWDQGLVRNKDLRLLLIE
ncbi:hypothetical protein HDU80_001501, partial [Chytriomyces hyalinus]